MEANVYQYVILNVKVYQTHNGMEVNALALMAIPSKIKNAFVKV